MTEAETDTLSDIEDSWRINRRLLEAEWRTENSRFRAISISEHKKDNPSFKVKESPITDEQIRRARDRKISDFLEPDKRGFILCPFHADKKPSMSIKKGFGHCFVCGENMDAIRFMMHVNGLGFVDAVKELQ